MTEKLLNYFNGDELAANVWLSKYAQEGEETPDDMHRRLAKEFARVEDKYQNDISNINGKSDFELSNYGLTRGNLTEESIYNLFKDFKYIIPQGSIMATLGTDQITSLSNCTVTESPFDSYGGILKTDADLANYFKRRCGTGIDISKLRPKGTTTKNSAKTSTGAVSFMHRFSNTTREVAQEGRRGALMITMNVNHPDILDFIKIKRDGTSVTGANISIRLNNEFMKVVENDEDYVLRFPCDIKPFVLHEDTPYNTLITLAADGLEEKIKSHRSYYKKIKAKELWDEIVNSATYFAEPGIMFWDNILDYDPAGVYKQYWPISSNPCGEQFLQANDSCRLTALNLVSFVENPFTGYAQFNFKKFYEVAYEHARLGDNLVDLELEHIQRIIDKIKSDPEPESIKQNELQLWLDTYETAKNGRRIGLGFTALGDTLAALDLKYDSDEALKVIEQIMNVKMEAELDCTIDLSILRGSFTGYNRELEYSKDVEYDGKRVEKVSYLSNNSFYKFLRENFNPQFKRMLQYGRRNVSFSTVAPTGSVSILTQTTSGVEPLFQPYYMRRKKINPNDSNSRVDFVDDLGDKWQEFPVLHPKFKDWINNTQQNILYNINDENPNITVEQLNEDELQYLFEQSPWYRSIANDIDWSKRIEVQSIIQKYTTNAISSTINLPRGTSPEVVSNIYLEAWKKGLKGVTVYVDGSRDGVLIANSIKDNTNNFEYVDAVKRPKELKAEAYISKAKGQTFSIIVGLLNDKPYEIFVYPNGSIKGEGLIIKQKKGEYDFIQVNDSNSTYKVLTDNMTDEQAAITRLTSTSLRHRADIKFVVEQLNKCDGDLFSFTKALARVLKKYIPDGTKSSVTCDNCGSSNVVFEEGCQTCKSCGHSKCS